MANKTWPKRRHSRAEREEQGTSVILHIKPEHAEYLETFRLRQLVERYSDYIPHSIEIRHGGHQLRIPIDEALAAIDQTIFVQADERFTNGSREALVHREAFA